MAMKKVQVEVTQGEEFKTECRAGEHTVIIDQPVAAGGTNAGPTPLEYQLFALGGCITAIGRIIAKQKRLRVRSFRVSLEGELDTDKLLGKATDQRVGFNTINAKVRIDSDMTPEEKEKYLRDIETRCPISDCLVAATAVNVVLEG